MLKEEKQLKELMESLDQLSGDLALYRRQHPEVDMYLSMAEAYDALLSKIKTVAKELAIKRPQALSKYNKNELPHVVVTIEPRKEVNIPSLEEILGKDVTKIKGLANVKVTVPISKLTSFVDSGKLPEEARKAIFVKTAAVKVETKEF